MNYSTIALIILAVALVALGMSAVLRRRQATRVVAPTDIPALRADIVLLLQSGDRVQAVKLHRRLTGSSLQEANDAITDIGRQHGL